ncbi:hypothetical protein Tco_1068674 [Tanacetum coccineum]|uniref:Uncharacterized protein n=1 Tax=Tanacetum coccineum TaxID=301880 RepID=A0ABQ5HGD5_9ASTR
MSWGQTSRYKIASQILKEKTVCANALGLYKASFMDQTDSVSLLKINFKKVVAQKFREYDQKLEALTNFNVSEAFEKAVQAKVLTEIKKLQPTHIPKVIANYVRPRLNTSVLENSGLAKRRTTWFDLLLKSDIDQNKNHILGSSTVAIAKKLKAIIQKNEPTIADLEGAGLERLKQQYQNDVKLEYHHYAARYNIQGIEDMILDRWSKETHRYIFEALNVRRSNDKEYEFSYAYLPRLSLNNVEDMYLFQVQDKLLHLPLEFVKDFNNALLIFTRRVVIQNRVEDIQLGVESYQQTLNLTKPMIIFEGIDQKIPFTMSRTHKGVVYLNQHNVKSFMKLSEVKKLCDGTLIKIRENLVDMVKRNKLGTGNKRLKGRDWTNMDVEKSNEMVDKIDKKLKRREPVRRLEEYVGGRPTIVNPRTFVRPV